MKARFFKSGAVLALTIAGLAQAEAGHFTNTTAMSSPRSGHTATLLRDGRVLVASAGIYDPDNNLTPYSSEVFNPVTQQWTNTGPVSVPRTAHTATLLGDGMVLVAGGVTNGGTELSSAEVYDPASNRWTRTGSLRTPRYGHTATLLRNGQVLVAGGYYHLNSVAGAELYDPVTGLWTVTGPLNIARVLHVAVLLPDGKVLVAGGYNWAHNWGHLADAEIYDPDSRTWAFTGPLNTGREGHTGTLLGNGKVLVAGGLGSTPGSPTFPIALSSAELYDPMTRTWTSTGALRTGRRDHVAVLLPLGKVLVAAGWANSWDYYNSAELFDPDRGTWTSTANLAVARVSPAAVLLANGQVLIAGGFANGAVTSTAELYLEAAPIQITQPHAAAHGGFQFGLSNTPGVGFSVLAATNPSMPLSNWVALGTMIEAAPGQFQFTDTQASNASRRFYRVRAN